MVEFNWDIDSMTASQQKIAEYIERNLQHILGLTEQELADTLALSIASVSRFWRAVGYKNMKDFKQQMTQKMVPSPAGKIELLLSQTEKSGAITNNFQTVINHLELTLDHFSEEKLNQAALLTLQAKKIFLYGQGSSVGLLELLYFRLSRYGLNIHKIQRSGSELLEDLVHITKDDLLIIFYFSQKTLPEEAVIFKEAEDKGFKVVAISDQLVAPIANQANVTLYGSRGEPWEFHSMVAPTMIIEMLVISVGSMKKDESLQKLNDLQALRKKHQKSLPR